MRSLVKAAFLAAILLTSISAAHAQVSIGISIGAPPPPRVVYDQPRQPGPGFVWVEGYWYPIGHHYRWHAGYWTQPPYEGASWVPPYHNGEEYFAGYWAGDHGRVEHDHHWDHDHDRDRDYDRDHDRHDHDHDHGHGHDSR